MEESWYGVGDVFFAPTQRVIAGILTDTLGNSPEFSADVINWARRFGELPDVEVMRHWYRANEAALKAGDFKAVQPGADPPERKAPDLADEPPSFPPGASRSASAPVLSAVSTETNESSGNVYAWIAALLLGVFGGLVWLLKRKRT